MPPSPLADSPTASTTLARAPRLPRLPTRDESGAAAPLAWGRVLSACGDGDGSVYLLVAEHGGLVGQPTVLALDADLRVRWTRRRVPIGVDGGVGLVASADALIVWTGDRVSALRLGLVDGADLDRLGARQPAGADRHHLDLRGAVALAIDGDGSVLLIKERRLVRCAATGAGVETWPPRRGLLGRRRERLVPFGADTVSVDTPMVNALPDYPAGVYRARLAVGWDGCVYLYSGAQVTCVERDGRVRWRASLPAGWYGVCGADTAGNAYIIAGGDAPGIHRIDRDGRATVLVDGRRVETPLREDHLVVRPDGTLIVVGDRGAVRVFSADGAACWRSDSARIDDDLELTCAAPAFAAGTQD